MTKMFFPLFAIIFSFSNTVYSSVQSSAKDTVCDGKSKVRILNVELETNVFYSLHVNCGEDRFVSELANFNNNKFTDINVKNILLEDDKILLKLVDGTIFSLKLNVGNISLEESVDHNFYGYYFSEFEKLFIAFQPVKKMTVDSKIFFMPNELGGVDAAESQFSLEGRRSISTPKSARLNSDIFYSDNGFLDNDSVQLFYETYELQNSPFLVLKSLSKYLNK